MTQTELKEQMREDMLQESYCIKEYAKKATEVFSKPLHPLVNKNSKHYDNGEKTAIERIEEKNTVCQMIGACTYNILKYSYRQDAKGQKVEDIEKIKTFQEYKKLLESIDEKFKDKIVSDVFEYVGLEFRYR